MLRFLRWTGLFLILGAFVLPVSGADKADPRKKTDDEKSEKTKGAEKGKEHDGYVTVATYEGTITQVAPSTRTFTLQMINRSIDPQDAAANAQRMAQLQQQLAQQRLRNPGAAQQTLFQIAQLQSKPPKFIEQKMDKQFEAPEDCKVRISDLPVEFGEKGGRKKLTKEELAEKKGPGNYWGFPGEFEQVTVGTHVRIVLGVKKAVYEAAKKKKKTPPKKGAKPMEEDLGDLEDGPVVRQIHIMFDNTPKK